MKTFITKCGLEINLIKLTNGYTVEFTVFGREVIYFFESKFTAYRKIIFLINI